MSRRFGLLAALAALGFLACASNDRSPERGIVTAPPDPSPQGTGDGSGGLPEPGSLIADGGVADAPSEAAEPPPPPTVATTETIDIGGTARSYVLAVPRVIDASRTYPLVLALHGDGGDGAATRATLPIDTVAGGAAIVAYPSGVGGRWNLYDPADTNADLAFLQKLADALRARFTIGAVYGTGFSSGAFMVNQAACRRPSLFRAIAPHAGGAPNEPSDPTASKWENSYTRCAAQTHENGPAVIVFHGTVDGTVTYPSGEFTATYWAFINGCTSTRSTPAPSPCVAHDGCPAGRPVVLCPIAGMDHTIWTEGARATWVFFASL